MDKTEKGSDKSQNNNKECIKRAPIETLHNKEIGNNLQLVSKL